MASNGLDDQALSRRAATAEGSMAQGKTVYKVEWGPSKGTIYAAIGSIVASIYVPTWIQGPISCNFLLAFVCELLFCAAATLFFYDGQKRIAQMKVMATMLAFACGLGFLSNLFLQANFAIDNLLYSDGIVDTVINLCAVICTLTVYRMKPDTDATVSDTAEKSAPAYLKIKPLSVSISVAVVSLILMLNSNDLHMHSSYTANIPFFICAVIFLNVG